jgi:hypothetical protein
MATTYLIHHRDGRTIECADKWDAQTHAIELFRLVEYGDPVLRSNEDGTITVQASRTTGWETFATIRPFEYDEIDPEEEEKISAAERAAERAWSLAQRW